MPQWPGRVHSSPTGCPWEEGVHFPHVAPLTRIAAVAARPRLPLQQRRHARGDTRIMPPACAPIHLIARLGAPSRLPLAMAAPRPLRGEREARPPAWRRDGAPCPHLPPIRLIGPLTRRVRRAKPAPPPPVVAQRCGPCLTRRSAPARRDVGAPAPNDRVEGVHQPLRPVQPLSPEHFCDLSFVRGHGPAARGAAGRIPARGLRRRWPDAESPHVKPGAPRVGGQRVGEPGVARLQCQSPPAPLFRTQRWALLDHGPLRMSAPQSIRIADHGRGGPSRSCPLAPVLPPMPGHLG
jgi:hypothetical protein